MSVAFTGMSIGNCALKNRFARSATFEGMADDEGGVTDALIGKMAGLAANEVGLIISGHAFVSNEGRASKWQLSAADDRFIPGLAKMADAVHKSAGKIFLQLAHAGGQSADRTSSIGPSAFSPDPKKAPCLQMSVDRIQRVVRAFADAAVRAKKAGFDGVQVHAAHGYLISEFLSPYYNRRTDEYGGNAPGRARFLFEIVSEIRLAAGNDYPLCVKINSDDLAVGGMTVAISAEVCRSLAEIGVDAIELSGGIPASDRNLSTVRTIDTQSVNAPVYYEDFASVIRRSTGSVPLMLVGGVRHFEKADALIERGVVDMISLSRPLVCEEGLVARWKRCDLRRAECVSCNLCFRPALTGKGIFCAVQAKKNASAQ